MANISVDEIQSRVASIVDLDPTTSTISTADYALRLKYINMALNKWAEVHDWQVLYKEFNSKISTSTGNASVALPSDYRRLASYPLITWDGSTTDAFSDVRPQEDRMYTENTKRVNIFGNPGDAYTMVVKGVTLSSGASVKIPYYASPQSLASPANIAQIPNAEYLVESTIGSIWHSLEDERFPKQVAKAERILQNMIEHETIFNEASSNDRVRPVEETRFNFRLGRD